MTHLTDRVINPLTDAVTRKVRTMPTDGSVMDELETSGHEEVETTSQLEIRRRRWLSAAVAAGAAVVALAYLSRVIAGDPTALDWVVLGVLTMIAGTYAALLADSRAPLLIADEQGVRVRRGAIWRGIAWADIPQVEHHPRRGLFRDGLVVITAVDAGEEEDIALRLSVATRIEGVEPDAFTEAISELCGPDTAVLELRETEAQIDLDDEPEAPEEPEEREAALEFEPEPELKLEPEFEESKASATPMPLRALMSGVRAEITRHRESAANRAAAQAEIEGSADLDPSLDDTAIRLPETDGVRRAAPEMNDLIADFIDEEPLIEERPDPVIGPVLATARERIGLSVDSLSERTRIRPHVIEAIEVDDFAPCGGDFYARGHLQTLARVLGVEADPLLDQYAELYAHAPIDPRRVFEADLATGGSGSIRGTRGGPNWSVLIAAVMTVVLIWSVARLITDNPAAIEPEAPRLNPSGGLNSGASVAPEVPVVLTAAGGGARVIVRNGSEVVFNGPIAFGQTTTLQVSPPIRISTTDGSLRVSVDGDDRGAMGETGQEAQATYVVR